LTNEKAIQDKGVITSVPFVESEPFVEAEDEEAAPERDVKPEPDKPPEEDNMLKKAIEVLRKGGPQTAAVRTN